MAVKTLTTRVQQKSDTSANWAKATNFTPLKGEIIVYTDLQKIKIGDGVTKVGALEFANSKDAETLTGASLSTILNSSDVEIPTSKAVLDALDGKVDKANAGSDWNQSDNTKPDYIKNRPFYKDVKILDSIDVDISWDGDTTGRTASSQNRFYKVSDSIFTEEQFLQMYFICNGSEIAMSSPDVLNSNSKVLSYMDSGGPVIAVDIGGSIPGGPPDVFPETGVYFPSDGSVTRLFSKESILSTETVLKKIDEEFIPDNVLHFKNEINNKLDSKNPNAFGSFSMGRKYPSVIGENSYAAGIATIASGNASHAEGKDTTASGSSSHAEGDGTTASGVNSHSEGNGTIASGYYSHAEGLSTTASGYYSHAEGEGTIASSPHQHVQGHYNLEDDANKYAHIVGNGDGPPYRSNAHTLDWNGNAWYAGKVSIGTTSNVPAPTDVNDLVTKQYVDNKFSTKTESVTSVNGQTGDVTLTANDVDAIDKYNGMTPVECVYTHFGSQQTKIIYVEEGTLIPPSSSASDDIKNAWKRLLAIPLSGLAATGPNSSFKDLIRGIGLLADNGVFGDLLSQSGNEFICYTDIFKQEVCLRIYNSKTDDKTITVYFNYYKQDKYQQVVYCISNGTFDDYCSFDEPVKRYLNNINATTLTMPQTEMAAAPTKDMHIATKKYVDDSVSNPLNITSATVGQIAKISAVDDTGKPTTWETVDMPSGGGGSQPDWNQNDDTQPDYVKNRPFYTGDPVETVFVEENTVSFAEHNGLYGVEFPSTFKATVGETYKVYWDGTVYECVCKNFNNMPLIGNLSIMGAGSDTGEPFIMGVSNGEGMTIVTADTAASHTFSISGIVQEVVKIDPKYIRDMYYTADPVETVLVEESTVPFSFSESEGVYLAQHPTTFSATVGDTYKVYWDGTAYECTCVKFNNLPPVIGNLSIAGVGSDTGEPFLVVVKNNGRGINIGTKDTAASHTFSISGFVTEVVKIDEKYLPDTIATKSEVEVAQTTAENALSTANTAKTTAENALSTANTAKTTAENAVKYTTSQNLTDAQKQRARTNIGAGTSSFSGNYNDLVNKPISLSAPTQSDTDTTQIDVLNSTIISDKVIVYSTQHIFDTSSSIFTNLEKTMIYGYFDGGYTIIYDPELTRWRPIDSAYVKVNDAVYYGAGIGNNSVGSEARYFFISNNGFIIISNPDVVNSEHSIKYFEIKYGGANLTMPIAYLSERFIPPAIQRVGDDLILSSSTAGSTKKFKITVDDDYNVSATNTSNSVSKTLATTEYVDNYVGSMIDAAIGNVIGGSY